MEWLYGLVGGVGVFGLMVVAVKFLGLRLLDSLKTYFTKRTESKASEIGKYEGQQKVEELKEKNEIKEGKDEAKEYRKRLLEMVDFKYIRVLGYDNKQFPLESAYIKLRIHEKQEPAYKDAEYFGKMSSIDPNEFWLNKQKHRQERSSTAYSPDEALAKYKLLVFIGDPGAGKTTTLRYLTRLCAEGKLTNGLPDLPVYVPINRIPATIGDDLLGWLSSYVQREYHLSDATTFLERELGNGKILLLLDAIDESKAVTPDDQTTAYQRILELIQRLQQHYPKIPIVITCRKAAWSNGLEGTLSGFQVLEVLDYSWEDIQSYISTWFTLSENSSQGEKDIAQERKITLTKALKDNVRMRLLAANPLLLSLICGVSERLIDPPERRVTLYEKCTKWLLEEWDGRRGINRRNVFPSEHKENLLCELALYYHQKRQRYFRKEELVNQIAVFLPKIGIEVEKASDVLQELIENQGLIHEEGIGWYGFPHLTIQEYYCARALRRPNNNFDLLVKNAGVSWWEEVTLLYAGLENAAPLLQALLAEQDDIFHTNLFLATRCLAGNPLIDPPAARQQVLNQVFSLAFAKNELSIVRSSATSAIVDTGNLELRQRLFDQFLKTFDTALLDPLMTVLSREQAVKLIALFTNPQVADRVKGSIAESLGSLGEKQVANDLVKLLTNPQVDVDVKWSIANSLGSLGEKQVASDLIKLLTNPQVDVDVKWSIANSLGSLGEKQVASDLIKLLTNPQVADRVKGSIAESLGSLGEKQVASDLIKLLTNPQVDDSVKGRIALSLGRLGEKQVASDLVKLLTNPQVADSVKGRIALSLGSLGEKQVANDLVKLLTNPQVDDAVKWSIASSLGSLGEKQIASDLVKLLTNPQVDDAVKRSIAESLGDLVADSKQLLEFAQIAVDQELLYESYSSLQKIAERLQVRLFRDDSIKPPTFYVKDLPK